MRRYLIVSDYSPSSWARMIKLADDDRLEATDNLMHSVGGSLELMAWEAGSGTAYMFCDLPDSRAAIAVQLTAFHTGGFNSIRAHELLTEEQLTQALEREKDVGPAALREAETEES